jgi:surface antigen
MLYSTIYQGGKSIVPSKIQFRTLCRLLLALIALGVITPASAANTWFARESAMTYMTDEDRALLTSTMDDLLDNQPDGTTVGWKGPDSDASGKIAVGKTHQDYGTTCRLIKMKNTARGITGAGKYRLCKDDQSIWRFAPMGNIK